MSAVAKAALNAPSKLAAASGISQDNIIFALVAFAFVVWITTKGELPTYLGFFKPSGSLGPVSTAISASSTTGAASPSGIPGVPGIAGNPLSGLPSEIVGPLGGGGSITAVPQMGGGLLGPIFKMFGAGK